MRHSIERIAAAAIFGVCSVGVRDLRAQCADGSPPPCPVQRVATREPARQIDPNRIAILPFRVTTADTLLGEGFAELLATEFTGEGAPRAIDMATVLSAWRRAGGGPRSPLPRARALELARELGAGLVSEGSIVGLGHQITVTATILTVPEGVTRGTPARVTTPADSLDAALRKSATRLIATVGGQQRSATGARFTDSPDAMRNYLAGLSAWRRGRLNGAADAFDRAIADDSSFSQAIFRRYIARGWGVPTTLSAQAVWNARERLSPGERTVLEAYLGPNYPTERSLEQQFADNERAVSQFPDSPDALYFLGDKWFHLGGMVDPANHLSRARDYLARAAAIDSQATLLQHLLEIAVRLRDTADIKLLVPAFMRTDARGKWSAGWIASASIGATASFNQLRVEVDSVSGLLSLGTVTLAVPADVSATAIDEAFARLYSANRGVRSRATIREVQGYVYLKRGRPAAAERAWAELPDASRDQVDDGRIGMALSGGGTGLQVEESVRRQSLPHQIENGDGQTRACDATVWRMTHGDTTRVDPNAFRKHAWYCAWTLDLLRIPTDSGSATDVALAKADSSFRARIPLLIAPFWGYEPYFLARAWEAAGHPERALAAIRYRVVGLGFSETPWMLVDEGRLATIVGDTTGAIRAYRRYLEVTSGAEPIIEQRRDSVRAVLARLTKRP